MQHSRPTAFVLLLAVFFVTATPLLVLAADEHGGAKSGPSILSPRLDLTIWTIVVFAVLLWVLKKLAWKPMLQGLQGREDRIRGALDEAQTARDEAHKLRDQIQAEMVKLNDKIREMMDEARREGQQNKERLIAEGKKEIQDESDRKRREIQMEAEQAKQELWNQTAQLVTLVSAQVIGKSLNADDHRNLVEQAIADLRGKGAPTA